jgi:ketosteroid isomerase-like protein
VDTVRSILRFLRIAAVATLAGLVIASCGGGDGGGSSQDEAAVKQTVEQFLHAVASGDGATACSLATPEGQARLVEQAGQAGANCTQVVASVSVGFAPVTRDGLATATVTKVGFDGDTATVADEDIASSQGDLGAFLDPDSPPIVLAKQLDGTWKLTS